MGKKVVAVSSPAEGKGLSLEERVATLEERLTRLISTLQDHFDAQANACEGILNDIVENESGTLLEESDDCDDCEEELRPL